MHFKYLKAESELFHKKKPLAYFKIWNQQKSFEGWYGTLNFFSIESFEEGVIQLVEILKKAPSLEKAYRFDNLFPSVRFFIYSLFNRYSKEGVKSAALLFHPTIEMIEKRYHEGFKFFKLKFKKFERNEIDLLEKISDLNPQIRVRLDFNQQLNIDWINTLLLNLPPQLIDYIEEPSENFYTYIEKYPHLFAVDESLRKIKNFPLDLPLTYVIKPSLQDQFEDLIFKLKNKKQRIIISSSFDSPSMIEGLKHLIYKNNLLEDTHGIDTTRYYNLVPSVPSNFTLSSSDRFRR